ncbi:Lachesin [Stylophora pistillata]|uniref:Lachesin n=1 Tax=Stylophora pistillata TaxID=50429 RepID=A0A2B4RV54_STYPI|nr:Lachesin [Stylophora pistillata]
MISMLVLVSETRLKNEVPNTVVNISGYNIFRRDRNWSGCDSRNKGGIAIYTRSNLSVIDVYRSNLYEFIFLTVLLPSGNCILLSGLYRPPKTTYQECDLMDYLLHFFDTMLDKHPNVTIVCGGDLNHLDLTRLKRITGWTALVDFPTRGDSFLDNCLTDRPELFGKALSIKMLIKTDHIGFIVPAGKKLKPIRQKLQFRDCREHRKRALYIALASECWDDVLEADSIETAVNILELKILTNINWCMPLRTVSLSSRDPSWMTPLVKYMLRSKSPISVLRINKHRELSRRVLEVIGENRRLLVEGKMGSRERWKNVDLISQRRRSTNVSLDRETAQDLNEYFGDLCTDGDSVEPALLEIGPEVKVPEISERYVWNSLSTLKKTATGPDQIPFWVWKDQAEIFTSIITKLWNLSLATHQWPRSWKRANINPLPKVDVPVERGDFRGINVTPVIARALEKAVYKIHVQRPVEEQLLDSQFAYRERGSSTDALLLIPNKICKFLDDPKYPARIENFQREILEASHQNVTLQCPAAGNPPPKYTWSPCRGVCDELKLHLGEVVSDGVYTCSVTNNLGSDAENVTLFIAAKTVNVTLVVTSEDCTEGVTSSVKEKLIKLIDTIFEPSDLNYIAADLKGYSCGSVTVYMALKFNSITKEKDVIAKIRTAVMNGTTEGFTFDVSSITGTRIPPEKATEVLTSPTSTPKGLKLWMIILIVVGVLFLVVLVGNICCWCFSATTCIVAVIRCIRKCICKENQDSNEDHTNECQDTKRESERRSGHGASAPKEPLIEYTVVDETKKIKKRGLTVVQWENENSVSVVDEKQVVGAVELKEGTTIDTSTVSPQITSASDSENVTEGSELVLFCNATGKPVPNITWTRVLEDGTDSQKLFVGNPWIIVSISRTATGTYSCTADNGIRSPVNHTISVNVLCEYTLFF